MSVGFNLGGDIPIAGHVVDDGVGTVLGRTTSINATTYGDVYGTSFTWSLDFGYRVRPLDEVRVRVLHSGASGQRVQLGSTGSFSLFGDFDDYSSLGLDFGYRRYLAPISKGITPYGGMSFGFLHLDSIDVTLTAPINGITLPAVPLYDSSTVALFTFGGGVQLPIRRSFAVQAGLEFRWHGGLGQAEGLNGTGLEGINDSSGRWSLPITVGGVYRF